MPLNHLAAKLRVFSSECPSNTGFHLFEIDSNRKIAINIDDSFNDRSIRDMEVVASLILTIQVSHRGD